MNINLSKGCLHIPLIVAFMISMITMYMILKYIFYITGFFMLPGLSAVLGYFATYPYRHYILKDPDLYTEITNGLISMIILTVLVDPYI